MLFHQTPQLKPLQAQMPHRSYNKTLGGYIHSFGMKIYEDVCFFFFQLVFLHVFQYKIYSIKIIKNYSKLFKTTPKHILQYNFYSIKNYTKNEKLSKLQKQN